MIFAGGYNLKKQHFGQNFKYILLFGLLGTVTVFGMTFGLTTLANHQGYFLNLKDSRSMHLSNALVVKYSATISASDSVAALTLINPLLFPKLFSIIFGEGMVNDAVAIILFKVVGGIFDTLEKEEMGGGAIAAKIIISFVYTVLASIGVGVLSGTAMLTQPSSARYCSSTCAS